MASAPHGNSAIQVFLVIEWNREAGELRRHGTRIRLQDSPFQTSRF